MFDWLIKWLEENMGTCPYVHFFGVECPGCGFQRALIELLQGHIAKSIELYPALIPLILLFSTLIVHLIFKLKFGAKVLKYLFLFTVFIIVISYIVKIKQLF